MLPTSWLLVKTQKLKITANKFFLQIPYTMDLAIINPLTFRKTIFCHFAIFSKVCLLFILFISTIECDKNFYTHTSDQKISDK